MKDITCLANFCLRIYITAHTPTNAFHYTIATQNTDMNIGIQISSLLQ